MMNVMSFNIRYGLADDGENRWEQRKTLVIDRIKAFDPDLLGMQECRNDSQAEFVKASLPDYEFLGVQRGGDGSSAPEMAPILVKKSTFAVRQWETFWLSESPHTPGSRSWGSVFPRTVTWADLIHQASGRSLIFVNTHFDYEPSAIQASARMLKEWIGDAIDHHPFLLTGDFNADKNSSAYRQLTFGNPPLTDIFRTGKVWQEDEGTFHGYGVEVPAQPIDWILLSDHFSVLHAEIDSYHHENRFPSDHYPITATLDWKTPS
jgi:endonuclease/exonuclease/phosphatase family metal-dependent hydrolase